VLLVCRIYDRFEEVGVSWHSTDVFRRARILPVEAYRPVHVWIRHECLLDLDPMLPVVAVVVEVGE
jgi:hypothetical protein